MGFLAVGERTYSTNGLKFETIQDAVAWGNGLMDRWYGAKCFEILPVLADAVGHLSESFIQSNKVVR